MFVPEAATILHADLDAFYASVEQRDDPKLKGRPVIVGGGVVLAASYEAKARGVRTAMGGGRARSLCPNAVVVPPRMEAYSAASRAVFEIFRDTTPAVEGLSIDEAFLDARGLGHISGTPEQIARRLKRRVLDEVGLPITVGVARTKFLAKVASAVAKPDGLLVVPPDKELAFLHPLPVERLWGVGPVTSEKLRTPASPASSRWRACPRSSSWRCSVVAPAAICTRSPTTGTRAGCRSAGAGVRWARRAPSAGAPTARAWVSTPRSWRWWTESGAGCAPRSACAAR